VTRRTLAILFSLFVASAAHAQSDPSAAPTAAPTGVELLPDTPPATAPAAWTIDPAHADTVKRWIASSMPDGVKRVGIRVWSYRPAVGGGQLIVSVTRIEPPADPAALVRERITDVRSSLDAMAATDGPKVRQISWSEEADAAEKSIEVSLGWAHDGNETLSMVRARFTLDGDVIDERRVECVLAAGQAAALRDACYAAMESLQLPAAAGRKPLALVAAAGEALDPGAPTAGGGDAPAVRATPDGVVLPPKAPPAPAAESRDWRPLYVVAGMIVLIAALLWNRSRRKELEAEHGPTRPRGRKPDSDADELADAAENKDDKDEEAR
jgi:hypothetical protein